MKWKSTTVRHPQRLGAKIRSINLAWFGALNRKVQVAIVAGVGAVLLSASSAAAYTIIHKSHAQPSVTTKTAQATATNSAKVSSTTTDTGTSVETGSPDQQTQAPALAQGQAPATSKNATTTSQPTSRPKREFDVQVYNTRPTFRIGETEGASAFLATTDDRAVTWNVTAESASSPLSIRANSGQTTPTTVVSAFVLQHVAARPGTYSVIVTAFDPKLNQIVATKTISFTALPPQIRLIIPNYDITFDESAGASCIAYSVEPIGATVSDIYSTKVTVSIVAGSSAGVSLNASGSCMYIYADDDTPVGPRTIRITANYYGSTASADVDIDIID